MYDRERVRLEQRRAQELRNEGRYTLKEIAEIIGRPRSWVRGKTLPPPHRRPSEDELAASPF